MGGGGSGASWDRVHFGLGTQATAGGLTVIWPGGSKQEIAGPIAADRLLTVQQP